jgi:hypothetical protein
LEGLFRASALFSAGELRTLPGDFRVALRSRQSMNEASQPKGKSGKKGSGRKTRPPSALGVMETDYPSVLCIVAPLVGLGLWLLIDVAGVSLSRRGTDVGPGAGSFFLRLGGVAFAVCVPLLAWRVRGLMTLLREGTQTPGRVTGVDFFKDRGSVTFAYTHEGQDYEATRSLSQNSRTRLLEVDQPVTVVVDPENPARALIRDLYAGGDRSPFFLLLLSALVCLSLFALWKHFPTSAPPQRPEPTLAELKDLLHSGIPDKQLRALKKLKQLGPQAESALPELLDFLNQGTREARALAADALAAVGPRPGVLEALEKAAAREGIPGTKQAITRALEDVRRQAGVPPPKTQETPSHTRERAR